MYIKGQIGQRTMDMLIDSGANISLLNYAVYHGMESAFQPELKMYGIPMVTADGTPMNR
jgi:hypothetical protein